MRTATRVALVALAIMATLAGVPRGAAADEVAGAGEFGAMIFTEGCTGYEARSSFIGLLTRPTGEVMNFAYEGLRLSSVVSRTATCAPGMRYPVAERATASVSVVQEPGWVGAVGEEEERFYEVHGSGTAALSGDAGVVRMAMRLTLEFRPCTSIGGIDTVCVAAEPDPPINFDVTLAYHERNPVSGPFSGASYEATGAWVARRPS